MVTIDKVHSFAQEEALSRIQALTRYWSNKYGVKTNWNGSRTQIKGRVKGIKFDGYINVEASRVFAQINVGFLAKKLGAVEYVEKKLVEYLNPSASLDTLQARAA